MRRRLILPMLLGLLLAACRVDEAPPPALTPTPADPATLGRETFAKWCVPCHGADGQGFVNALNAPALNAGGEAYKLSDQAILDAIIDGGAASGGAMAPLGNALTDEQEAAVLQYLHTLWTDEERAAHVHAE
ncbi:MAG: cytochrome c [Candidatus Promineofilum sp.]|nr:cytochrome c [Promineifilum sp.]